jgi:hypothetical protein
MILAEMTLMLCLITITIKLMKSPMKQEDALYKQKQNRDIQVVLWFIIIELNK